MVTLAMVHFVVHFLIGTLTLFLLCRGSCCVNDNNKQHRSNNTILLNFVKVQIPEITPAIVRSDCNQVPLNVILAVYLDSMMLLCWWYVLCTMQMHLWMEEFLNL